MNKVLYKELANLVIARNNCRDRVDDWFNRHHYRIEELVREHMPSGSGIDSGVQFDFDRSTGDKLVFNSSFHYMNDNGYYCGWIDFTVTVTPSLSSDFDINIRGKFAKAYGLKDYLYDVFNNALETQFEHKIAS